MLPHDSAAQVLEQARRTLPRLRVRYPDVAVSDELWVWSIAVWLADGAVEWLQDGTK